MSVIRQLLFPGKKPKEIIETGDDDEIDTDPDAGKKKVNNYSLSILTSHVLASLWIKDTFHII